MRFICFLYFLTLSLFAANVEHAPSPLTYSQTSWEPFVFQEHQSIHGLIPDYLSLLEQTTPLRFHYNYETNWSAVIQQFHDGKLDLIPGISGDNLSQNTVISKPIFKFHLVLAGKKTQQLIESFQDVEERGLIVAVGADSSAGRYLKHNYPFIQTYSVQTVEEGLIAIEHKKADLFLEMAPIIGYALQNSGLVDIHIVGILKDTLGLVIVLKDDTHLNTINQAIDTIGNEASDALYQRYIKVDIKPKIDYSWAFGIFSLSLVIFIGFTIWLYLLKREIRKRKIAEAKTKLTNKRLKHSSEDLKKALVNMAQAHQIKSQFLANMSHEIRTPMNTIIGVTELILRKDIPEKERHYLTKVAEAGHHLLDIINDILDFSKIEANKIELETIPFKLEELILSITNMIGVRAHQKGLELLIDMGNTTAQRYKGDPLRLKQILLNLISNAIKFTHKGEVIIRLHAYDEDKETQRIRFEVQDTGIGIKPEQMNSLFVAFSQADMSTTRQYGGTGLGLSIAQGLAMMMEGEICCISEFGKGSTFFFEIPLLVDTTYEVPMPTVKLTKALKVLVVDDNPIALEIFSEMLEHFGVECTACSNAHTALELLRDGLNVDVAIIDWKMDDMDGVALYSLMQQRFEKQIASIMMVTAYDKEALAKKMGTEQPYAILVKPITASTLFEALVHLHGYHRLIEPFTLENNAYNLASLQNLTVLLVEDNESNQEIAAEILNEAGIIVHIANNGQEALEWLKDNALPDCILMDCQMPVLDGYAATHIIKEEMHLDVPIIAITANVLKGDEQKCYDAGMDGYVPKPVDGHRLLETIAKFCHKESPKHILNLPKEHFPLDGINSINAIQNLSGNTKLYRQLLKTFAKDHIHFVQNYQNFVVAQQFDDAKSLCQTLKDLAKTLGMEELADLALQAQMHAHPLDKNDLLLQHIDHAIRSLSALIQALSGDEDKTVET